MEKVEQAICIYMICLSVKISISYFAWKALNRNPTACLPHIRGIREGALIVEEPHQTQGGQHGVVGAPFPTLFLLHCCGIVGRGIGNKCLLVGYLFPFSLYSTGASPRFTLRVAGGGAWPHFHLPTVLQDSFSVCSYNQCLGSEPSACAFSSPLHLRMDTLTWGPCIFR